MAQHLKDNQTSLAQFQFDTGWRISWARYLETRLTDANLQKYFDSKRREFDGTQLKVAHLLLKDASEDSVKRMKEIQKQIVESPGDWNKLVAAHSEAASRNEGGIIGWIGMQGPMPTEFTQAAFQLKEGAVSDPVSTNFGLHLIRCVEIKPGKKGLLDSKSEVMQSAKKFLFYRLADEHRDRVQVRYTGNWPHE